jgi:hypothetical protein
MSRKRVQRSTPRHRVLGAAAFAVVVAGLIGPAGGASATSVSTVNLGCPSAVSQSGTPAVSSLLGCLPGGPRESLGVRWQ